MSGCYIDPAQALEAREIASNRIINETIKHGDSPVQGFYDGAVVLLTGASGFLGKGLIEKLFRSCKIQKIYILMRTYQNKSLQARVDDITSDMLYDYLHQTQPEFVNKLVPISGDISEIRLGIDDKTWRVLSEEVNVIFHAAATINFVEPLKKAVLTNVLGTREMIKFAHECKNLKSFVHVSTAFCHAVPERVCEPVLEKFYDAPFSPELLISFVQGYNEANLDKMTPTLLGNWPNTYSFTKAVAEEAVRTMAGKLPICIVRPAIVMPAYREPPGWVDRSTMNGPFGFVVGACLGGLHVMFARHDNILDVVPVDYVNNAIILAAYETYQRRERGESDVKIYTITNNRNPCFIGTLHTFLHSKKGRNLQTPNVLWYPYTILTTNPIVFTFITWFLHFIPGYIVDSILKLAGKRSKVVQLFKKAYKHNKIFSYFMTQTWEFDDKNVVAMYRSLSPADQVIYNCDIASVDLERYMPIFCIGGRKYLLKDGLENTEYAIKKGHVLRVLNYIYMVLYTYLVWKILVFLIQGLYNIVVRSF